MKLNININRVFSFFIAVTLFFTGCSEDTLDEVNRDRNNPTDVEAKFILADVLTRTAFSNVGGDINTYVSTYVEHEVGVHNQLWQAEHRETQPSAASTYNNSWGNIYTSLRDAKIIVEKCSEGGEQEGNLITKGIGEVMVAYNLALLTDMFGDAPWSEALDYQSTLTPKIDRQEELYNSIFALLDQAVVDLGGRDILPVGEYDLMYKGDAGKWMKFAYGLKARYRMRLLDKSSNIQADMEDVIASADRSFASASDQAAYASYDAQNRNPLYDFMSSRKAIGASKSMVDKLTEHADPRLSRSFITFGRTQIANPNSSIAYPLMAPNGVANQIQDFYNASIYSYAQTAPTLLLSYHEVLFLKAEAMQRSGKSVAEISPVLKSAVAAAIVNSESSISAAANAPSANARVTLTTSAITPDQIDSYFATEVSPRLSANPLKEIAIQKYFGFFGASGEGVEMYNDIRRWNALEENLIELKNTKRFPLRLTYGNDDTTTNPNVQAAYGDGQYVYTENVWWAGGTR